MSFNDDERRFRDNSFENDDDNIDKDFYGLDNEEEGKNYSNDSGDDFFKDEDFEFEGYREDEYIGREGLRSKKIKQKKKKRKAVFRLIAILVVIVLIAVGVVFWFMPWIKGKFSSGKEVAEEEEEVRITIPESLILGEDINIVIACAEEDLLQPDINSIIFSSYYSSENKLISLCIPPKTLMDIPGFGAELIGKSVNMGGMDLLSLSLKNNLGMNMEIDYYILFDVVNVVNKLGGIDLKLAEEVTIKNYSDDSTFTLKEGNNLIDGEKAVNFLKYYSGIENDVPVENIKNQKLIVDAIIKKVAGKDDEEVSRNLNLIKDFMDTDLSMEDEIKIFTTLSRVSDDNNYTYALSVSSTELKGEGIVYVPQDISKLASIFNKEGIIPSGEATDFTETVKITILNGAYDSPDAFGLAASAAEKFKDLKFDDGNNKYEVVEVGNSDNIYESTQILVYSPDTNKLAAADDIKNILGVGSISPREEDITNSDIIIILGKDYLEISKGSQEQGQEEQLVKIIVLNGEGTAGLAATVTDILDKYFNSTEETVIMLEPRSAENFKYTETKITVFSSSKVVNETAQKIRERLGVGVIEYSDNSPDNADISVTIGSDYTK
ncbi:MAG: LCP family protein [Actinomycetota bacterium]|nr:LCP family protein [Actinomycetota bacterium]